MKWKTQKRWERPGDPDSWRREYDLYRSGFGELFSETLSWPKCYAAKDNGEEIQLRMADVDGVSGRQLSIDQLEQAAMELGRFQGRLMTKSDDLQRIRCLGATDFMQREFVQWHSQTHSYEYLVSDTCRLPSNIKRMLTDLDVHRDTVFRDLGKLPVVPCHRDFWIENIFWTDGKVILIDWDTAGWGYIGEDMASLVVDEIRPDQIGPYYRRIVQEYMLAESVDAKQEKEDTLQRIYELHGRMT